jgi:phosphate:Na+ symporter
MESLLVMIDLFGAVGLLLFGLAQVKDGVSRAFGARLRSGLATGTSSSFRAIVTGFVATLGLQSSTATALMTASFVERNLIRPRMAQAVLLGANIGTAVTAWIVATGIEWLSPLIIAAGIVLYRGKSSTRQGSGLALIGIGLMLLSLSLLGNATAPLRNSPALAAFIGLLDNAWPIALIFSAVLAVLSSSSLAVVVLILSLASTGILSGGLTIALVLGANLGGAVPPVIATMASPVVARRVTLGNLIVRAAGCIVVLPMAGLIASALARLPLTPAKLPVDIHLMFNIAVALVAWPLTPAMARLMRRLIKDEPTSEDGPKYLDQQQLAMPVMALANATREVLRVGDAVEKMLISAKEAFTENNRLRLADIGGLERQVDKLQQEVKLYLSRLNRQELQADQSNRSFVIIDYAINLEHIGDIVEKGLCPQIAKKIDQGLYFSKDGFAELDRLFGVTIDNLRIAQTILVTRDFHLARQLMEVKDEIRVMEKQSSVRHIERLRDGRVESLQTSSLHLDMLRDLKRINAHIVSVAHPILDESGDLRESRLRDMAK